MAGSIQERGNGSYLLVYHLGYDLKGKRIRKTKTVRTRNLSEAKKKLASFVTEIENKEYIAPSKTNFGNYVKTWRIHAAKKLSHNTIETYDYILNNRIIPEFSHLKMEDVSHIHINGFIESLEDDMLASSTIQKHFNILSNIFKFAKFNDTIKINPMEKVNKPAVTYKIGDIYTPEELKEFYRLLDKEENRQQALIVEVALKTGMRKSEILALRRDDLDFNTNMIHIKHSLSYTKKYGYQLKEPKTKGSVRSIVISGILIKKIKKHIFNKYDNMQNAEELWKGGKNVYVFSADLGTPLFPDVPNRWLTRFLERVSFKKIRFHDLRHTFSSGLIHKGGNVNKISKYLGHASINTTMDIYGHYIKEDTEIADLVDEDYT